MKRNTMKGTGRPAHAFKTLLAGAAMTAALGFAMNAQAGTPDCTVGNWADAIGLADANTGHQGADNRRYGGPCALRVPVDGTARYVESPNLGNESTYHVRFYAFLDNANGDSEIDLFVTDAFSVFYDGSDVTLEAGPAGSASFPVSSGWYSIHVSWESDASANIQFLVANRFSDDTPGGGDWQTLIGDTSGMGITFAHLGNVNGASGSGGIDFDDFVSTRITAPDRLMVGDANGDGGVNVFDAVAVVGEFQSGIFADGQPDCDEDGSVNVFDAVCVIGIFQN